MKKILSVLFIGLVIAGLALSGCGEKAVDVETEAVK